MAEDVDENGHYATKDLPGDRVAHVYPLTYGRARIGVGPRQLQVYDDVW